MRKFLVRLSTAIPDGSFEFKPIKSTITFSGTAICFGNDGTINIEPVRELESPFERGVNELTKQIKSKG